jgi:hypothetical protein
MASAMFSEGFPNIIHVYVPGEGFVSWASIDGDDNE